MAQFFVGNALGWLATIAYLVYWHPELPNELAHADD